MNTAGQPTIAVLGTGRMGAPIARNLLGAQFPVTVWNRTAEKARRLAAGARLTAGAPPTHLKPHP